MLGRTRFRRAALALVACVLAPALVLSHPGVAQAATLYGQSDGWALDWSYQGVGGVACAGAARWKVVDGGTPSIIGQTKCRTTGAVTGFGGFDAGSYSYVYFSGPRVGIGGGAPGPGPGCYFRSAELDLSGDPAVASFSVDGTPGCMIDQVCQVVEHSRGSFFDDTYEKKCTTISLGEPPTEEEQPPSECIAGQLTGGFKSQYHLTGDPAGNDRIQANFIGSFPGSGETTKGRWFWYVALKDPTTGAMSYPNFTYGTATGSGAQSDLAPVFSPHWGRIAQYATHSDGSVVKWTHVTGVGAVWVAATGTGAPSGWNTLYTDSTPSGLMGRNEPANCRFYIGSKIASHATTTFDEPGGLLGNGALPEPDTTAADPVDDTEDGCGFSYTDPTTWASAGICQLVGLIRELISAVAAVAGAVVDGLTAALEFLFIPDPDSWDWNGFVDQVKARPPASIVSDMAETAKGVGTGFSGSGDCGVLADFGDGMDITCADARNVPGYSVLYGLVQVGLVALTGLGMFKMIRSSMGGNGQ